MSLKIIKKYGSICKLSPQAKLRKYGVPSGGPIDPFTPDLVRAALLHGPTSTLIEVMGTILFEARRPMSVAWMTPQGGFVKHLNKFERIRVTSGGEFAGYLGFTPKLLPDRNLEGMFPAINQLRYLPLGVHEAFSVKSTLNLSRVGFRFESALKSEALQGPSEPACQGLIQQTPSGQIIVLGPDGPVTGGYHKVGTIIRADWPYLASMTYFQTYDLIPVNMDIARKAYDFTTKELAKRCKLLRIIQENGNSTSSYRKLA